MREIDVEGAGGLRRSEQSRGKDPGLENLQRQVAAAREGLELRTAELEAAQARVTELEQTLRLIHQSRTYRVASRMWRIRARTRALFSRQGTDASGGLALTAAEEIGVQAAPEQEIEAQTGAGKIEAQVPAQKNDAVAPIEVPDSVGIAEVTEQPLSNGDGSEPVAAHDGQPVRYYGSRGVRATDQDSSGPLRAVLLLGGLTERQLDGALRALALDDAADGEPLVVTDCDALRTLDSSGYLYEYIPPRADWERHLGRNGDDYDDFVRRRLASIAGMYGLAGVPSTS